MTEPRSITFECIGNILRYLGALGYEDLVVTDAFEEAWTTEIANVLGRQPENEECLFLSPGLKFAYKADLTLDEVVLLRLKFK
jgi:hypothetical protein